MKALAWHGKRDVRVDTVPDPTIEQPTDAVIRVTSSGICGSDLHLYEVLGPFIDAGDVLGHEPMGIVEEVGAEVTHVAPGDRVVIPFNISCGHCWMCDQGLQSQCETTQVREHGTGAAFLGYARPGPDRRDEHADRPAPRRGERRPRPGARSARAGQRPRRADDRHQEHRRRPRRRARAHRRPRLGRRDRRGRPGGARRTGGQARPHAGRLPPRRRRPPGVREGGHRPPERAALAIELVRRGGTISVSGVYGGAADPMPMPQMFDKQIQFRMGQANVRRWTDDILPLLTEDGDPLGVDTFATHHVPLDDAPHAYEIFQKKQDGAFKILLKP